MSEDTTMRCYRATDLRVEDDGDGKPKITGLAVPFNAPSEMMWDFVEVFKPGAFKESLASKDDMFANVEHDRTRKLGRRSKGTLEFQSKKDGLYATITPPDTATGRDTIQEVREGLLDAMSIAFTDAEDTYKGKGENIVREINKATLKGVTLTSFPAYRQTIGTVAERSFAEYRSTLESEEAAESEGAKAEQAKEAEAAAAKAEESRKAESELAHAKLNVAEAM